MSHVLRIGVADQIAYFRAFNDDGSAKNDFTSTTAGASLSIFRTGLSSIAIATLSDKAADNTTHTDGAIRRVGGNLYTLDMPDSAAAAFCPSIGVRGSYTGGVIEPVPHPLVGYDQSAAAVGANTTQPPSATAIASQVRTELSAELGRIDQPISTRSTFAGLGATAPAGWINAAAIATAALNGKGDWNIGKTGYSLVQLFPANFASLGINASGHISRVTTVDSVNLGTNAPAGWINAASIASNALEAGKFASGAFGAVWSTALASYTTPGTAGFIVVQNLDAKVSTISSGGGGGTDWTADERTAIRTILGIPASGTAPADPSAGILDTIRNAFSSIATNVWGHPTRLLSGFSFNVSLAADQAVNITKVAGISVAGPNDFKADLTGIPAAVWSNVSRTLTGSVTVGGYAAGQSPANLVDITGIPAAVWGHTTRLLSGFNFNVTVGGYAAGQSPAQQLNVSGLAAKTDLPVGFSTLAISGGQVSANNVAVTVNPTVLDAGSVAAIQNPILAAISTISPAAADFAIKVEIKYQGNGVPNCKVALVGSTSAALTDANGLAQLNVNTGSYLIRISVPDGYQFVADIAVAVLTADVTLPINLAANSLPSVVPPLSVTYDEIRRHVGRFLGFGANPDQFEDSQSKAVEDTIRQGLRDVYFPSINGAPYEWSFLKKRIELQLTGGNAFALPSNFVRLASQVTIAGLGYPLRQVSESALRSMAIDSNEESRPIYFALAADGDALQLGVTLYKMLLFPTPPSGAGHVEFWYHTSPELDFEQGGPLGGSFLATTIIEACLARAEIAQNVESIGQSGGIHVVRAQEMLRRSIEADRSLQAETLHTSMADQTIAGRQA